jgi:hypothetical protein
VVAPDMRRSVVTIPGCKPIPRKLKKKKANKNLLIMMASSMIAINDDNTTAVKRKGS